jgi:hypothetical protein
MLTEYRRHSIKVHGERVPIINRLDLDAGKTGHSGEDETQNHRVILAILIFDIGIFSIAWGMNRLDFCIRSAYSKPRTHFGGNAMKHRVDLTQDSHRRMINALISHGIEAHTENNQVYWVESQQGVQGRWVKADDGKVIIAVTKEADQEKQHPTVRSFLESLTKKQLTKRKTMH